MDPAIISVTFAPGHLTSDCLRPKEKGWVATADCYVLPGENLHDAMGRVTRALRTHIHRPKSANGLAYGRYRLVEYCPEEFSVCPRLGGMSTPVRETSVACVAAPQRRTLSTPFIRSLALPVSKKRDPRYVMSDATTSPVETVLKRSPVPTGSVLRARPDGAHIMVRAFFFLQSACGTVCSRPMLNSW